MPRRVWPGGVLGGLRPEESAVVGNVDERRRGKLLRHKTERFAHLSPDRCYANAERSEPRPSSVQADARRDSTGPLIPQICQLILFS